MKKFDWLDTFNFKFVFCGFVRLGRTWGGGEAPQATQSAQDEIHAVRVSWGVGGAVKSIFEEIPVSKL